MSPVVSEFDSATASAGKTDEEARLNIREEIALYLAQGANV